MILTQIFSIQVTLELDDYFAELWKNVTACNLYPGNATIVTEG